jgi:chaperonin GroES
MNIRPLHDYVIVQRSEAETMSRGGVVIPGSAAEKPGQGRVIAASRIKTEKGGKVTPMTVKTGNLVLFGKSAGTEIEFEGEKLIVMHESDIMAVIES